MWLRGRVITPLGRRKLAPGAAHRRGCRCPGGHARAPPQDAVRDVRGAAVVAISDFPVKTFNVPRSWRLSGTGTTKSRRRRCPPTRTPRWALKSAQEVAVGAPCAPWGAARRVPCVAALGWRFGTRGLPPRPWDGKTPPLARCFLAGVMEEGRGVHGRSHMATVRRMTRLFGPARRHPTTEARWGRVGGGVALGPGKAARGAARRGRRPPWEQAGAATLNS